MPKILNYAGIVAILLFYQAAYSQITVATAANMKFAMEELRADFFLHKGDRGESGLRLFGKTRHVD
jgi:ABC-type molybdate transport system substrate-binding protein